jgi:hypothetical protein
LREATRFREILGIVQGEFLTVKIADARMGFHNNSRFVAVDASHERTLNGSDQAILEFVRVFAEVPDIALSILGKPIKGIFCYLSVRSHRIVDFDAPDTEDGPGAVRHRELACSKPWAV